ncbi:MAG TPA: transketolase [Burkholderiaceae bacterium]|nr:transketolase [Burkholderiaceae bacterium]
MPSSAASGPAAASVVPGSAELARGEAARMAAAIRVLAMDAVEKAASGHPGMPMGMAEIAVALWGRHLKHNPAKPGWFDRDRFVLSNGHGSMLIYALLHLTGYDLPIEEIRAFRTLHSKTPGHPEVGITPGVETTTGPLGQGLANAVGMALAERMLAAEFNRDGFPIVDHFTWVFAGDGCLMEGISHEACSLAGTWGLSKLVVLYDDNGISIDGEVGAWFRDDTVRRFEAYGWNVVADVDGHDVDALDAAIALAKRWGVEGRETPEGRRFAPTLIQCRTVIGKHAPTRAGKAKSHGEPLGAEEIAGVRRALGWSHGPFEVPADVYASWDATGAGAERQAAWDDLFRAYAGRFPAEAAEFERRMRGVLPANWEFTLGRAIDEAGAKAETIATRKASQNALNHFGPALPELLGGSADLTGSNLTDWKGAGAFRSSGGPGDATFAFGRHLNWGVREFGMSAAMNGIALHGGYVPFGGTFLTFSDYSRNALRMAALMRQRVIFVFTHDSIGLGEDGPTHQSIEHAASLRLIPSLDVWRPADPIETTVAWGLSIERDDGPSALLLSRQAVPFVTRSDSQVEAIRRGGYVVRDAAEPRCAILATGSELGLALAARDLLAAEGIEVRVVSMPSTSVFDRQDADYRRRVLPDGLPRVAVEAGVTDFWWKYRCDAVVGIDRFGESAPAKALFEHFGFTPANVADTVRAVLAEHSS